MRFTRYDFVQKIAVGGMAEVWAARALATDGTATDVVVKRILPQFADDATFQGMLLEEAVVTARLHHPNIVRVLDWGHMDETCFLAMEHVHGLDARQLLAACAMRKIAVPVAVALHAVAEILAGLDYAHRRTDEHGAPLAIVHRDVSPANVLLSVDGSVKLSDFGIAKAKTRASHTRVGRVRGKPRYMSPEQARGEALDARSDLFSAGLVLHELLTGRPVFPQSEYLDQVVATIERGIPPPSQANPFLPGDLDALVLSLCERDLARRHPTCGAAREAILSWAAKHHLRLHGGPVAELVGSIVRPTQTAKPVHTQGVTRIARLEDVDGVARFASETGAGAAGADDEAIQTRVTAVPPRSGGEPNAAPGSRRAAPTRVRPAAAVQVEPGDTSTVAQRGPVPGGVAVEAEPSVPTVPQRGAVPDGISVQAEPSVPTVAQRAAVPGGIAVEAEPSVPTVAQRAAVPDGNAVEAEPSVPTVARRDVAADGAAIEAERSVPTVVRGAPVPAEAAPERTERRAPDAPHVRVPEAPRRRRPWLALGATALVISGVGAWRLLPLFAPSPVVVGGAGSAADTSTLAPAAPTPLVIARSVADFVVESKPAATPDTEEQAKEPPEEGADDEIPADALVGTDARADGSAWTRKKRPRGVSTPKRSQDPGAGAEIPEEVEAGAGKLPPSGSDADVDADVDATDETNSGGETADGAAIAVPPAPPPAGRGWLSLRARPNGEVTINGEWAGRTPITRQELAAGEHTVVVNADDGRRATAVIVIEADVVTSRTLDLK